MQAILGKSECMLMCTRKPIFIPIQSSIRSEQIDFMSNLGTHDI